MISSVAILGANGFIGSRTIEVLHLKGLANVRPVVRRPAALASASRFGLEGRVADANDTRALAAAFADCDYVVYAVAGDPSIITGTVDPVYRAAQEAQVRRLVYLSSASVHGQSPAPGTNEASILDDSQPIKYNVAKIQAERRLAELRTAGSVEVVILRPGIVFGPRSQWTGGFADDLLAGTAYLVGGGYGICNSVYVDNLVHAIHLAFDAPAADGQAYLVGDREHVSWRDLCRPIAEALGFDLMNITVGEPSRFRAGWGERLRDSKRLRKVLRDLPGPTRNWLKTVHAKLIGSAVPLGRRFEVTQEIALLHSCRTKLPSTKAQRELGYEPIVDFDEGCRRSISWLAFAGYPVISRIDGPK